MSLSKQQRKKIARKVKTRVAREKRRRGSLRAKKAQETGEESEKCYIPKLAKLLGVSRNRVIHHVGLPDLMVIGSDDKITFYEAKPKKGGPEKRLLNAYQKETVKRLLKLGFEQVYIVEYEKRGESYYYDKPIPLTVENLNEHCV